MRSNIAILLTWVITLAFATSGNRSAGASGDSEGDQAQLEIKGSSGTEFSGSCAVGDSAPEQISGHVPQSFTYDLNGKPLKCKIASKGDLEVTLTVGNTRSVQRISGGTLNLTYQNGSISSSISSSSVSSSSVSSSSVSSQVVSSSGETAQESSDATNRPGNVTSEPRDVSGFDEVELQGVGKLYIEQTGSESLTVEAEESILPKIRTEVVNNRLIIGSKPNANIQTTEPINYELTVKDLSALEVSGLGTVEAEGISTKKLASTISGSGTIEISGRADSQEIDISGTGSFQAKDLESKETRISVSGSGSALVNASDELDAEVSGSGSVQYIGDPTVNQIVSGAGRVSKY